MRQFILKLRNLMVPLSIKRLIGERMWSISTIIGSRRKQQGAPRKTVSFTLSTKNLAWIVLGWRLA
jgi:hypothetical protein